MKTKQCLIQVCLLAAVLSLAINSEAQTITYVDLLPPGASNGAIYAISANQQAGRSDSHSWNDPRGHATIWSNTPASATEVYFGAYDSVINGTAGSQQAGWYPASSVQHACFWSGTFASLVDLHPSSASQSGAMAASGSQQAGYVIPLTRTLSHAAIWSGSSASFTDLNPSGASGSTACATTGSQQAGVAYFGSSEYACIWSGSAASYVDVHPPGVTHSVCWAMANGQQAGYANIGGSDHAAIWSGSAASFVDINPTNATSSDLYATTGSQQAGTAVIGGAQHAGLWFGTAASLVDLHIYLPPEFFQSQAKAIWTDGNVIKVGGYADSTNSYRHPFLWTIIPGVNSPPAVASSQIVGNSLVATLTGLTPGQQVISAASTTLTGWTPIQTNTATGSSLTVTNPYSASVAMQFFRLTVQ